MSDFRYFQNRQCQYFPCHPGADPDNFNCLFCFCPLFALGDSCGGDFVYSRDGYKDCSGCLRPHRRENYDGICAQSGKVAEMTKKA